MDGRSRVPRHQVGLYLPPFSARSSLATAAFDLAFCNACMLCACPIQGSFCHLLRQKGHSHFYFTSWAHLGEGASNSSTLLKSLPSAQKFIFGLYFYLLIVVTVSLSYQEDLALATLGSEGRQGETPKAQCNPCVQVKLTSGRLPPIQMPATTQASTSCIRPPHHQDPGPPPAGSSHLPGRPLLLEEQLLQQLLLPRPGAQKV